MNNFFSKVWFLLVSLMFIFACFLGRGWLIGLVLMMIIGLVKIK